MVAEARVVGQRYGHRGKPIEHMAQWWPVYDRPPRYHPLAVGGACPPDMYLGQVSGGWSCVGRDGVGHPPPALGQEDQLVTPRTVGAATVGAVVGLFFGYVLGKM